MKYTVEFEMKELSCWECPLANGSDECNLQDDNDFEDMVEEQLNFYPLKEVGGIE